MALRTSARFPWMFFLLVFLLSIPFWVVSATTGQHLGATNLTVSSLMVFNPLIAALILTYREKGSGGVKALLKRIGDYQRIKRKLWYLPTFCLIPIIFALAYGLMFLSRAPLPEEQQFPILSVPVFFGVFFVAAIGEEVGWSGYATDQLQGRRSALSASLILGSVWAIWHILPDLQAQRTPLWIMWQRLYTVALRVLIVWLYNNTGQSVFATIVLHATDNVSLAMFPNYGSHYNPFYIWLITASIAVMVIFLWGPQTLAHYRYARLHEADAEDKRV